MVAKPAMPSETIVPVTPTMRLREGRAFVLSQYPLAHLGAVDQLGMHRFQLDRPFTSEEAKVPGCFHVELGRL